MAEPGVSLELVVCSLESWDQVWRRNQYLVDALIAADAGVRVLFVNPPVDQWGRPPSSERNAPVEIQAGLWQLTPAKVMPRLAGPWADVIIRRQVRDAVNELGFRVPVLWINDVNFVGLAQATSWGSVYDITDDWLVEASAPRRIRRRRQRLDSKALRQVDEVVVCSDQLRRSRSAQRPIHLVPNGVDAELMTTPAERPTDLPSSPVAAYVGTVQGDRFDIDLVIELARRRPDLAIAIIGPVSLDAATETRLAAPHNVHLLGPRDHRLVPGYLQHADVVIVPHLVNPFTESLDPIKAYESLAVGVPTVATPVAGFRELGGPVASAHRGEFVDAVGAVVDRGPVRRRSSLPATATWSGRAQSFAAVLHQASRAATDRISSQQSGL